MMNLMHNFSHPGEVLSLLYLSPLALSAQELAKQLAVPDTRIEQLIKGETSVSADMAMRLASFFGTTPEYWMNLQRSWDLARAP
jgi:addiction module HigA family antidote